jgi:hypothetical protein
MYCKEQAVSVGLRTQFLSSVVASSVLAPNFQQCFEHKLNNCQNAVLETNQPTNQPTI